MFEGKTANAVYLSNLLAQNINSLSPKDCVILLEKLSVVFRFNVSNLGKIVYKTDLLKTVLVVKGRNLVMRPKLRKFSIAYFDNRKNSAKCLEKFSWPVSNKG